MFSLKDKLYGVMLDISPEDKALLSSCKVDEEGSHLGAKNWIIIFSIPQHVAEKIEPVLRRFESSVKAKHPELERVQCIATAPKEPPARPSPPRPKSMPDVAYVIAIASGKGGVGKSTVTANLAVALQARGLRVGVLDADIYGPSQPILFDLEGQQPEMEDGKILPLESGGIKVMSVGSLVDPETALAWRGAMVTKALNQLLRDVAWQNMDALLIDMPPGTGDIQLSLVQNVILSGAVIVSTPQKLALADVKRGISLFEKVDVPILGVIENMASFVCPSCNTETRLFGSGRVEAEALKRKVPYLGRIPLEPQLTEASDQGILMGRSNKDSVVVKAFADLAQKLHEQMEKVSI